MDPHMFDGLETTIKVMCWMLAVSVPLGIWKLIEIVVWFFSHISWQ